MVQLVHVVLVVDQERSEAELALSAGVSDHETVFMSSHTHTQSLVEPGLRLCMLAIGPNQINSHHMTGMNSVYL